MHTASTVVRRHAQGYGRTLRLPGPRGSFSAVLFSGLLRGKLEMDAEARVEPSDDEDLQIALWALYELAYRGFDDIDPRMEWNPAAIQARAELEQSFEQSLRDAAAPVVATIDVADDITLALKTVVEADGPSIAGYLHRYATPEQFREFMILRSIYHLKEADPHAWLLPRLEGASKVALAEILYDEYGDGSPERSHQRLFAEALGGMNLDSRYGHYIERVPGHVLAVSNAMTLFCLNRRMHAAGAGHLAAFEMTSSLPARRIVQGAQRLELAEPVVRYFDEHVEADAVHEQVASRDLCGNLFEVDPACAGEILFGAVTCVRLDLASAQATLGAWRENSSALRAGCSMGGDDCGR